MLSVVTVTLKRMKPFLDIFLESLFHHCKAVKEVIVVHVEEKPSFYKVEGIVKHVGGDQPYWAVDCPTAYCAQHAHGLHVGFEKTTQEYVMISDPDIFFYMPVDEYYLSLIHKHNINIIGISRPTATCHSIQFFPSIMNFVMRKRDFPSDIFATEVSSLSRMLNTKVPAIPSYFHPIARELLLEETRNKFALPDGHYETGCRMYLWAKENNMRWLAFQTLDCNVYQTCFYRNNFGLKEKFPRQKLLYHESLSAGMQHNKIVPFTENYRNSGE